MRDENVSHAENWQNTLCCDGKISAHVARWYRLLSSSTNRPAISITQTTQTTTIPGNRVARDGECWDSTPTCVWHSFYYCLHSVAISHRAQNSVNVTDSHPTEVFSCGVASHRYIDRLHMCRDKPHGCVEEMTKNWDTAKPPKNASK